MESDIADKEDVGMLSRKMDELKAAVQAEVATLFTSRKSKWTSLNKISNDNINKR